MKAVRYILYVREETGWEKLADFDAGDQDDAFDKAQLRLRPSDRDKPIALQSEANAPTRIIDPQDPERMPVRGREAGRPL